ncbi:CocE/NonD family hydrolase, partial [Steroidobacter sp.]|uniref:CocE/NonD family hydrolase n=1 Tax=Steroidobacter sp. TaxID=1978227 RepID=UPI001A4004F2
MNTDAQGIIGAAMSLFAAMTWAGDLPPDKYKEWTTQQEIYVPMRDGVRLSTDVALPKGATGRLPTILIRTPYDRDRLDALMRYDMYLKQGYAVVLQNERGRFFSEGDYSNYLQGASKDGYDTIDWIAKQPWSNGKVGTFGCSSPGEQQWPMAAANHPAHAAMIPYASGTAVGSIPGNETRGAFYRGGVPWIGMWAWWYSQLAASERLLLPADSTPEQRVRLRNTYSLTSTNFSMTPSP